MRLFCEVDIMKKTILLFMCALMLSGAVSCAKNDKAPGENTGSVADSSEAYSENTKAPDYRLDEFDEELISYLCLNGYDSSNFLVSPEAFRASLCLAAEGARGNTRTELLKASGFSGMDTLNTWYSDLNDRIVNSVWSSKDTLGSFTESYVSKITGNYNAGAYSCRADELTQAIKDRTSQRSNGMTFDEAELLDGASSVIIGTLNLQTAWKASLSGAAVDDGVFAGNDGSECSMSFAEQTGEYLYAEENGVQVLVIPMENDLSFVCFSGNRTDRFGKITSIKPEKVRVVLPGFELESVFDSRDLFGFLLERGVNDAVNSRTANFYNMCSDGDWFMQEIVQKARISIEASNSPETNEAADADTGGDVKEFIADGPFSFMVFSGFGTERQHMMLYGQMMNTER